MGQESRARIGIQCELVRREDDVHPVQYPYMKAVSHEASHRAQYAASFKNCIRSVCALEEVALKTTQSVIDHAQNPFPIVVERLLGKERVFW